MAATTWWAFVQAHFGLDPKHVDVAKAARVSASAVSRWASGSTPDPSQAARLARSVGRPVLEAFVAAGYLTNDEAEARPSAPPRVSDLDDDELLHEIRRRLKGGEGSGNAAPNTPPSPPTDIATRRGRAQELLERTASRESSMIPPEQPHPEDDGGV